MPTITSIVKGNCNNNNPLVIPIPSEASSSGFTSSIAISLSIGTDNGSSTGNDVSIFNGQYLLYCVNSQWNYKSQWVVGVNYTNPTFTEENVSGVKKLLSINYTTNKSNLVALTCFYTLTYC